MRKSIIILIILLTTVFSCSKENFIATVDSQEITLDEFKQGIDSFLINFDPILHKHHKASYEFRKLVVNDLIQEKILLEEADKQGISVTDVELEKIFFKDWGKKQKNRLIIQKLIKKNIFVQNPITDKEIHEYYVENKKDYFKPTQYRARQIVVNKISLAKEIYKKLKNGESFSKLAEKYSISPDKSRGGDLGFFDEKTFPEIFVDICKNLKIGETSEVISTDYGYQIFELLDIEKARQIKEYEVKEKIKIFLKEQKGKELFLKWYDALKADTKIVINEKFLREVNLE